VYLVAAAGGHAWDDYHWVRRNDRRTVGGVVIAARDYSPSTAGLLRRYRWSVNFPTVIFRPPVAFVLFWSTFLFLSSQPTLDLSSTHFYSFCARSSTSTRHVHLVDNTPRSTHPT
jgi:hypothetical protein